MFWSLNWSPAKSTSTKLIIHHLSLLPSSAMAKTIFSLPKNCILIFLLLLVSGGTKLVQGTKTWCVAKPSSNETILTANLNWACTQVDCSVLRAGCPCFDPNTLINHASIAMNLYYQAKGRNPWNCVFKDSALLVVTDPSYGNCSYPFS